MLVRGSAVPAVVAREAKKGERKLRRLHTALNDRVVVEAAVGPGPFSLLRRARLALDVPSAQTNVPNCIGSKCIGPNF